MVEFDHKLCQVVRMDKTVKNQGLRATGMLITERVRFKSLVGLGWSDWQTFVCRHAISVTYTTRSISRWKRCRWLSGSSKMIHRPYSIFYTKTVTRQTFRQTFSIVWHTDSLCWPGTRLKLPIVPFRIGHHSGLYIARAIIIMSSRQKTIQNIRW